MSETRVDVGAITLIVYISYPRIASTFENDQVGVTAKVVTATVRIENGKAQLVEEPTVNSRPKSMFYQNTPAILLQMEWNAITGRDVAR